MASQTRDRPGIDYCGFMSSPRSSEIQSLLSKRRREANPTRSAAFLFSLKVAVLRVHKMLTEWGRVPRAFPRRPINSAVPILAESRSSLYTATASAEWALQAGKVQNLRIAVRALNGRSGSAHETFSFWSNVGRATRRRGFVQGRELREGCVIPNIGGGLCQLSNALYDAALKAGFEILERHEHSRQMPDSRFIGRDATVFWNYVDLRFRSPNPFQIAAELTREELIVRFHSIASLPIPPKYTASSQSPSHPAAESCETCGIADCFRHADAETLPRSAGAAWLVDAFQPEMNAWMMKNRSSTDCLVLPLNSLRYRLGPYRWTSDGFAAVRQSPLPVVRRSMRMRRLATQGAARQRALLQMDEAMARALARQLPPLVTHVSVSQNLLPFLWRDGVLGGRTFDVLMTRLPLDELEAALDAGAARFPESRTFADFRAPSPLIQAEREALAAARKWITPHADIAARAGERAQLLEWKLPSTPPAIRGSAIIFPASTLARKGAYELRAVARELRLPIRLVGPTLESPDFWNGVEVTRSDENWLNGAAVVVLPAWVEHQPRRLLQAIAAGVPVIASEACGLKSGPAVTVVPVGDGARLRAAIESVTGSTPAFVERNARL